MHPLQKQIFKRLLYGRELPFSKVKPKEVESNIFMYHLRQLIDQGLVAKFPTKTYGLTHEGLIYADRLSFKTFKPRIQPKIVTMIVCKNTKGEFLLYRKIRQPFLVHVCFPHGKLHLGESVLVAAARELKEKTNLKAQLTHRGDVYVTVFEGKAVLAAMLCHIFSGKNPTGKFTQRVDSGECFWADAEKVLKTSKTMPGFADIYQLVRKPVKNFFFKELKYQQR